MTAFIGALLPIVLPMAIRFGAGELFAYIARRASGRDPSNEAKAAVDKIVTEAVNAIRASKADRQETKKDEKRVVKNAQKQIRRACNGAGCPTDLVGGN